MRAAYLAPVVALALLGCNKLPQVGGVPVPAGDDNAITRGFVCTSTPTAAYSPGFVYRVDAEGIQNLVNPLSDQAQVSRFETLFGTYTATLGRGAGLKFALDTPLGGISGGGDIVASSGTTTKVAFSDGELVLMTDVGVRKIAEMAAADLVPIESSTYYVVRDSIQAKGFDITLTRSDEAHLGGHIGIQELVSADPNLSFKGDTGLVINGTFTQPLNVCVRAVRLDPVVTTEPAEVSGGVEWKVTTFAAPPADLVRLADR